MDLKKFIQKLPKAELHLHIEGTLEPELAFALADRNQIKLPYPSVAALRDAYDFQNLQDFLNLYYAMMQVLVTEQDFFDLTMEYIKKIQQQGVKHIEIFFDPQVHMQRGVAFEIPMNGILAALGKAKASYNISYHLIPCILRDHSLAGAEQVLELIIQNKKNFIGIGLDSAEKNYPPRLFENVFAKAQANGLLTFAHAGEEGPAEYIWEAINLLKVRRIDHGVRCVEDESLMDYLCTTRIALTTCPLSNLKLKVFSDLQKHPLKTLLSYNICATVNSDDPAYFGGYINENYLAAARALELSKEEIYQAASNSFFASVLTKTDRDHYIKELQAYCQHF